MRYYLSLDTSAAKATFEVGRMVEGGEECCDTGEAHSVTDAIEGALHAVRLLAARDYYRERAQQEEKYEHAGTQSLGHG